ncbi:MAG: DnaD domain-containing protein [Thermomicrobiales bacterium]
MTRDFGGFLATTDPAVAIPKAFLIDVLPQITEMSEVQTTLTVFRLAEESGGIESPVAHDAIVRDRALRTALRVPGSPREPDARIEQGLDLAAGRGTLLAFSAESGRAAYLWYYVNTPVNQGMVAAMSRGAIVPPAITWASAEPPRVTPEKPTVFRLYEQNIGLLTPLIADHLVAALERYPQEWIEDAIAESVTYNRRSWRYVQRILEQWAAQGRG